MTDELTIDEACKILLLGKTTVRQLADAGALGPLRRTPGGHRRLSREAVEAYAARLVVDPPAATFPIQFGSP